MTIKLIFLSKWRVAPLGGTVSRGAPMVTRPTFVARAAPPHLLSGARL